MATYTIFALTPATTFVGTDEFEFQLASGGLSKKVTGENIRKQLFAGGTGFTANDPIAFGAATVAGDMLFTDATYDIGKTAATRPRDGFFSRNVTVGGTLTIAGTTDLAGTLQVNTVAVHSGTVIGFTNTEVALDSAAQSPARWKTQSFSIGAGGTADVIINPTASGGGSAYAGVLVVHKNRTSNATFATNTVYFVHGRDTTMNFASISTGNGSGGGSAFSVANSGTGGTVRITDTVTEASELRVTWLGEAGT